MLLLWRRPDGTAIREREIQHYQHYPDTVTASSMSMTLTYDEQLVRNILDRLLLILIITHLGTELSRRWKYV